MAASFSFPFYVIGEKPRRFSIFNFRHVLPIFNFNFLSPVYGSSVKRNSTSRYFAKPSKFKWHTFWKFQFPPRWIISCAKHAGNPVIRFESRSSPSSLIYINDILKSRKLRFIRLALISNYSRLFKSISISIILFFLSRATLLPRKLSFRLHVPFFETLSPEVQERICNF